MNCLASLLFTSCCLFALLTLFVLRTLLIIPERDSAMIHKFAGNLCLSLALTECIRLQMRGFLQVVFFVYFWFIKNSCIK
jgi:hypothetical protein